ncbi:H-NS family nucleoid-associated regulatory protein [Ramlibacter sp. AN1015]|uniref:H-NS family nucleoid-associated regulatory protein n=1 Tax=Ramlibacter sp. AN1015 TaxID=3133428 RepID=UPI0030C3750F
MATKSWKDQQAELDAQIRQLQEQRSKARETAVAEAQEKIDAVLTEYGLTNDDIAGRFGSGRPAGKSEGRAPRKTSQKTSSLSDADQKEQRELAAVQKGKTLVLKDNPSVVWKGKGRAPMAGCFADGSIDRRKWNVQH